MFDSIIYADIHGEIRWSDIYARYPEISERVSMTDSDIDLFERSLISVDELDCAFASGANAFLTFCRALQDGNLSATGRNNPHVKDTIFWREWNEGWKAERTIIMKILLT